MSNCTTNDFLNSVGCPVLDANAHHLIFYEAYSTATTNDIRTKKEDCKKKWSKSSWVDKYGKKLLESR